MNPQTSPDIATSQVQPPSPSEGTLHPLSPTPTVEIPTPPVSAADVQPQAEEPKIDAALRQAAGLPEVGPVNNPYNRLFEAANKMMAAAGRDPVSQEAVKQALGRVTEDVLKQSMQPNPTSEPVPASEPQTDPATEQKAA